MKNPHNLSLVFSLAMGFLALVLWRSLYLPGVNAALLPIFALGLWSISTEFFNRKLFSIAAWTSTIIIGFFIAIYHPEGFEYPMIWQTQQLYPGGSEFSLRLNTSKALGGYLVIVTLLFPLSRVNPMPFLRSSCLAIGAALSVALIAHLGFNLGWEFKLANGIAYFVMVNLFISVISEEAFFRLLLQEQLEKILPSSQLKPWIAVLFTSVLFAFAHTTEITPSFVLYFIAGSANAIVFSYTKRFSMAILTHFTVNIIHFIFLTYPLAI